MSEISTPTKLDIEQAHERIRGFIHRTPILTSRALDEITGAKCFFKCENFQKIGAFKARGAVNAVQSIVESGERVSGFVTHSSGNHGQAVAWAASTMGIPAYIVMPKTSPKVKIAAVKEYGAEVILCEPTQKDREETMEKIRKEKGAVFIHPYDDYRVICGQATCAKELMEDEPSLTDIISPVGGGGLLSGTLLSAKYFSNQIQVRAGEPEGADDAKRSLEENKIQPSITPKTIADGLLTSLGERTFPIIKEEVQEIITVSDEEIINALSLIWERLKIIIEPSCAVPLAVVLKEPKKWENRRIGLILTGGNIDLSPLKDHYINKSASIRN